MSSLEINSGEQVYLTLNRKYANDSLWRRTKNRFLSVFLLQPVHPRCRNHFHFYPPFNLNFRAFVLNALIWVLAVCYVCSPPYITALCIHKQIASLNDQFDFILPHANAIIANNGTYFFSLNSTLSYNPARNTSITICSESKNEDENVLQNNKTKLLEITFTG